MKTTAAKMVLAAWKAGRVVPAFNIPHLPMMAPVVRALRDTGTIGLIQVARLEWIKFEAGSMAAVRGEYEKVKDERFTRLHLDHVPVIDEDGLAVDFEAIVGEAIELGYESVMVDGSRLPLEENIAATARVVERAHAAGVPVEAELGAVLGHEAGPLPPYEELFATRRGFTDPEEAGRFVKETGVDWLSVAVGNIHGAVSGAAMARDKPAARIDVAHLDRIREKVNVPLVLHGGSGIENRFLIEAFRHGIAKINIGTVVRRAYVKGLEESDAAAVEAVYDEVVELVTEELEVAGSAEGMEQGGESPPFTSPPPRRGS